MNLRTRLKDLGASALIAFMMSFSLSCTLLCAVTEDVPFAMAALCCAAVTLLCALVALNKITAAVGAVLAAAGVVFAVAGGSAVIAAKINPLDALRRAVEAVGARIGGEEADLHAEVMTLMVFLSVLFGVVSFMMVRLNGGVYPAVLLFVFVMLGSWFLSREVPHLTLIPGLIALAVLYAHAFREHSPMLRALPAALIAAVLAVLLPPASPLTWQPLQDAADKVRELFNDYFLFNDPRIVYSVSSDGYQPALDALGGPATPRQDDVMVVSTDESLLLRGAVSRTYTGRVWVDEAVNSRYLYADPTRQNRKNAAFDLDAIDRLKGLTHKVHAEATFTGTGTSTLFVPQRLISLSTRLDMPVYYNETGEVFITRGVEPGDSYAFDAWLVGDDRAALIAAVNAAETVRDADWEGIRSAYMGLPGSIEANLYWLLMDITEDAPTPIEKAFAIRDYLNGPDFRYAIEGSYPPNGRDFVSWFVLDEKTGYCTYYASAMAVMARLVGIPSRYAEGYRVAANASGETVVTGEDAHAWAELYFNGIGWLTFDATPGESVDAPDRSGNDNPDETPLPSQPPATPEPTAEPTPEPTEAAVPDGGDATSTPEPESTVTPEPEGSGATPEPSGAPDDAPDTPPNEPDDRDSGLPESIRRFLLTLALILLLILLIALLIRRRVKHTSPDYLAAREKDGRVKAMIWYRAVLRLLERAGLAPEGGESPEMFAARAAASENVPNEFAELAGLIAELQYSPRKPDGRAAALGETVYNSLARRMTRRQRFDWTVEHTLHGIGDYTQIP